jgi:hypothetical protein
MATTTTEFYNNKSICFYSLRTYEETDQVTLNLTFTNIIGSDVYFLYKMVGDSNYTEE